MAPYIKHRKRSPGAAYMIETRELLGLTQAQLAEKLGLSSGAAICFYETGKYEVGPMLHLALERLRDLAGEPTEPNAKEYKADVERIRENLLASSSLRQEPHPRPHRPPPQIFQPTQKPAMRGHGYIFRPEHQLGHEPELVELPAPGVELLELLRETVGGDIEAVPGWNMMFGQPCAAFCNEHGKQLELPANRNATLAWRIFLRADPNDVLCGNVIAVTGDPEFMEEL